MESNRLSGRAMPVILLLALILSAPFSALSHEAPTGEVSGQEIPATDDLPPAQAQPDAAPPPANDQPATGITPPPPR